MIYAEYFKNNVNILINNFVAALLSLNSFINIHIECFSFHFNNFINEINDINECCNIIVHKN